MNFTLGISELSNTVCKRRLYIYILSRRKKKFLEKEDGSNNALVIGKVIHTILQISSKNFFSFIEYYFYRKKKSIEEAIYETFKYCLDYWKYLLSKQVELRLLDIGDYSIIINKVESQLPVLSNHFKSIIYDLGFNVMDNTVIDDEFQVVYEILPGVLINGKIDLVCFDKKKKKLKFIELKSGKPSSQPRYQLRYYNEIFNKRHQKEVILESWNSNIGPHDKGFSKRSVLRKYSNPELKKVENLINFALKCNNKQSLPPPISFPNSEKICQYCDYCDHTEKLFSEKVTKNTEKDTQTLNDYF